MRERIIVAFGPDRNRRRDPGRGSATPGRLRPPSCRWPGALRVGVSGSGSPYQATDSLSKAFGGTPSTCTPPW